MNYKYNRYNRYNRLLKGRITSKEESRIIGIQQLVQQGSRLNLNNALFITISGVDFYLTQTIGEETFYLQLTV